MRPNQCHLGCFFATQRTLRWQPRAVDSWTVVPHAKIDGSPALALNPLFLLWDLRSQVAPSLVCDGSTRDVAGVSEEERGAVLSAGLSVDFGFMESARACSC